jgi:hypothetical protein
MLEEFLLCNLIGKCVDIFQPSDHGAEIAELDDVAGVEFPAEQDEISEDFLGRGPDGYGLKHYQLEETEDPWPQLAFELAWDFVPGFAPPDPARKRGGRRKVWTAEERKQLLNAVQAVRAEKKGRSVAEAIYLLKKRDPKRWTSLNKTRYYEALLDPFATGDFAGVLKRRFGGFSSTEKA